MYYRIIRFSNKRRGVLRDARASEKRPPPRLLDNLTQTSLILSDWKRNPLDYTSVAFPTDEMHIPSWFKDLPFDNDAMESTLIDNKLGNLLGVLGWDIKSTESKNTFNNLFDFGG